MAEQVSGNGSPAASLRDLFPRHDAVVVGTVELELVELTLAQQDEVFAILLGDEIGAALKPVAEILGSLFKARGDGADDEVVRVDLQDLVVGNADGILGALQNGLRPLLFRCSREMAAVALDNEVNRRTVAGVLGVEQLKVERGADRVLRCPELRDFVYDRVTQAQFGHMLDVVGKHREWLSLGKRILGALPIGNLLQPQTSPSGSPEKPTS